MGRAKKAEPVLVRISGRGTVTIPSKLRARAAKTDLFEVVLRDDGVYELRPRLLIDPSQAWFWTDEWQAREREVDEAYAAGRYRTHTAEEFETELERRMKPLE